MNRPPRLLPFVFAALTCAALVAFAAFNLSRERDLSIEQTRGDTTNLARLVEAHSRQLLRRVDAVLAQAVVLAAASPLPAPDAWRALLPEDGLVHHVERLDAWGGHGAGPVDAGAADAVRRSEWFQALRDGPSSVPSSAPGPASQFGRAQRARDQHWLVPVARRIDSPSGGFDGAVVAWVDLSTLQAVLDQINTGTNGFVTLFLRQGWLIATAPANAALFERNWLDTPMFKEHLPRNANGTVQQVVVRDGTERVYSYRALHDYPVVVSVGFSMTDALADWHSRAQLDGVLVAVMSAALFSGAAMLSRNLARRDAAERALAESAGRTRAIVDHAADAIVTFGDGGRIESINLAGLAMFGHDAASLVGRDIHTIVPGSGVRADPADPADTANDRREIASGQRRDGSSFPIELGLTQSAHEGRITRIALIRDITEVQQAKAAIAAALDTAERSETFLRTITDNLPMRIAYVDRHQRYRFVNRAHCERHNRPREEIVGRTREELLGLPTMPAKLLEATTLVMQGQTTQYEFEEVRNGETRVMASDLVPDISDDGSVHGFYVASTDVTERHEQQRRIEQALAERETLLREVYHRVKNNLQVVQSLLNLQRQSLPPGAARAALDDSVVRVRSMSLVHEKLYQSGTLAAVPLRDYTADLLGHIGELGGAAARGITLQAEVDDVQASLDHAVPYGLLLTELASNALKHAFPEGRKGRIDVRLVRQADGLWLHVEDNGVGLSPGFELAAVKSMGLQLAARLAKQLGGSLQLSRESPACFSAQLVKLDA